MTRWSLIPCTILLACGGTSGPAPAPAEPAPAAPVAEADVAPRVDVQLVADVSRVAPDQEFVVAARLDIEPGWHVYWFNPGETGLPTRMLLTVPEGFEVGPLRYPGPARFDSPGPVTSYGYERQVVLSARLVAPASVAGPVEIGAEVSWLACKEACVPGSATPNLVLPRATAAEPSQPANEALFQAHHDRLPVPWSELDGASHAWETRGDQPELVLTVPGQASLAFFPGPETELAMVGQASAPGEDQTSLRLLLRGDETPERLTGVVRVESGPERAVRYGEVDLPWPPSTEPAAPAGASQGDTP